ncbi:hypothetical protein HII31_12410 [Pseudocercospora fuligena]|uniref:Uncharacterized protein n=1 Tax=Pseudocercospora fuligena TaxID=685502 RepID=A0A8H6VGT0_9PEZI|nr:hypothetical protein HII31_12410 [Pseudocercospora fuligena]
MQPILSCVAILTAIIAIIVATITTSAMTKAIKELTDFLKARENGQQNYMPPPPPPPAGPARDWKKPANQKAAVGMMKEHNQ